MLYKLKQWTLRVLDWSGQEPGTGCHGEDGLKSPLDPRELPRPSRHHSNCRRLPGGDARLESEREGEVEDSGGSYCCSNCAQLSNQLLECAICLEPLSSVTSCEECGNVACEPCAARLSRCPYCRADAGLAPNKALHRILCKLRIPSHNSVLPVRCPHKKCEWRGDVDSLSSHLEETHFVTILNGSSVTLDIAEFQRKAELSDSRPRHYSVLLSCFSDVFVCKVRLQYGKLKVALSQLTQAQHTQLAAWVEISCASKTMKGIIPLSRSKSDIEVPVTNFVSPACGSNDRVSISISIRPIS